MSGARVIVGDCRDVMATLEPESVDAIVTSPPYAEQRIATYGGVAENEYPEWFCSVMDAAKGVLRATGSVLVNIREHRNADGMSDYVHRTRLAVRAAGWCEVDELLWIKPNGTPTAPNGLPRRSWERVLWFSKVPTPFCDPLDKTRAGIPTSHSLKAYQIRALGSESGSLTTPEHPRVPNYAFLPLGGPETGHPATYPVALARWLCRLVTPPGGLILDPFTGSGSTGVAALAEGFRFLGVELSPEYAEIARRRILGPLFAEVEP